MKKATHRITHQRRTSNLRTARLLRRVLPPSHSLCSCDMPRIVRLMPIAFLRWTLLPLLCRYVLRHKLLVVRCDPPLRKAAAAILAHTTRLAGAGQQAHFPLHRVHPVLPAQKRRTQASKFPHTRQRPHRQRCQLPFGPVTTHHRRRSARGRPHERMLKFGSAPSPRSHLPNTHIRADPAQLQRIASLSPGPLQRQGACLQEKRRSRFFFHCPAPSPHMQLHASAPPPVLVVHKSSHSERAYVLVRKTWTHPRASWCQSLQLYHGILD